MEQIEQEMTFQQKAGGADVELVSIRQIAGSGGNECNFSPVLRTAAIRFFLAHLSIGGADNPIGGFIQPSIGVKLIANADSGPVGQSQYALVPKRVRVFETAELPPTAVEFTGHSDKMQTGFTGESGGEREEVVSPATGRQTFQFEVGKVFLQKFGTATVNPAGVVENRHSGIVFPDRFNRPRIVAFQHFPAETLPILLPFRFQAEAKHVVQTVRAAALPLQHDIEKDTIGIWKEHHHLLDHRTEMIEISAVETELVKTRFEKRLCSPRRDAGWVDFAPFRMSLRAEFIPAGGEINWNPDSDLVRGINLSPEEIERKSGMHRADLRWMIAVAVVAKGEAGDRIDRRLQ